MPKPWRPDGWDKTVFHLHFATEYKMTGDRKELDAYCRGVEDGADAMLKALRERGVPFIGGGDFIALSDSHLGLRPPDPQMLGRLVVIPDDEETCSPEKK